MCKTNSLGCKTLGLWLGHFGLGSKTLGLSFIIVGLGHVVGTCDGAILKVNTPVFVDVFLATTIMGDE